jgi:hypothetical protein
MKVNFVYNKCDQSIKRELVIAHVATQLSKLISLPETLLVELRLMPDSVYAETVLNHKLKNKIVLNSMLNEKEIIKPFIHECIHIHQMHTKQLDVYRDGTIYWSGSRFKIHDPASINYVEYKNLPWESDVDQKLPKLLETILKDY